MQDWHALVLLLLYAGFQGARRLVSVARILDIPQSLLALVHAYSCLAYAYFKPHERVRKGETVERDPTDRRDDELAIDLLYLSAVYANVAAACGL